VARKKDQTFDFEGSLKEMETLVEGLEQGDIGLEESLRQFEHGIALTRACQKALQDAEQKVKKLIEKNGNVEFDSFETGPDED
jgi:exodeoxyribonuclease VII small subunit